MSNPTIIPVHTEADFEKVNNALFGNDVTAAIIGAVNITKTIELYGGGTHKLRIVGDVNSRLNFNLTFPGWGGLVTADYSRYGLVLTCGDTVIEKVIFSGFNDRGACIRRGRGGSLTCNYCTFTLIGTTVWPFNPAGVRAGWGSIAASMVFQGDGGNLHINECYFYSCCTSNRYAHCIYCQPGTVVVRRSTFDSCGNPFQIAYYDKPIAHCIAGCEFRNPVKAQRFLTPEEDPDGKDFEYPLLLDGGAPGSVTVIGNTIKGKWNLVYLTAYAFPNQFLIDYNLYGEDFSASTGLGRDINLSPAERTQWLYFHDQHSTFLN